MNILIHTTASLTISVLLSKSVTKNNLFNLKQVIQYSLIVLLNVILHGIFDILPHTYPVNMYLDPLISPLVILIILLIARKEFYLIIICSFIGSILPDIIDLGPRIASKLLGVQINGLLKIFPWHFEKYSGSIFNDPSNINSIINHFIILGICLFVFIVKRNYIIKEMIKYKHN